MSIAIIFTNKDPQPWAAALKLKLPTVAIEVYPEIADPNTVEFLLCWKPQNDIIIQFPNLKVLQSAGASAEHILRTQPLDENVVVTRIVDDFLSNDMWEYLLAGVLYHLKNYQHYGLHQQQIEWKPLAYRSIKNTTVSILGLGQIGSFAALKFAELGFQVKGWSNSPKTLPQVTTFAGLKELPDLLKNTDVLINLLPLTDATANMIDLQILKQLNQEAFFINAGRGEHLVEDALSSILAEGHLAGAMLDVFRTEPLPQDHPFWKNPKIRITPHVASLTNINAVVGQIAANYNNLISGSPLINVVSKDKGY